MPLVGVAELAHLLKRDPKAIRFAVSRGRIARRPDGLFDADQAIAEWNANTLHERSHSANKVLEMTAASDLPLENEKPAKVSNYARARAAVQIYEARLKKLRYEEKAKSLVPARDVEDAAFRTVSCLREACMNIPARIAAQLALERATRPAVKQSSNGKSSPSLPTSRRAGSHDRRRQQRSGDPPAGGAKRSAARSHLAGVLTGPRPPLFCKRRFIARSGIRTPASQR
jgi:hypothetical protein